MVLALSNRGDEFAMQDRPTEWLLLTFATVISTASGSYIFAFGDSGISVLIGLALIVGATILGLIALVRQPADLGKTLRRWWSLVWDGFWGL
jgi:predicted cobalt transporter CbtA